MIRQLGLMIGRVRAIFACGVMNRLTGILIWATVVYRRIYFSVAEVELSGLRSNRTQ